MICYKDMTYCISKYCKNECGRELTQEIVADADRVGLPIAVGIFCGYTEASVNTLLSTLTGFPDLGGHG
jgi:hypothetical protein